MNIWKSKTGSDPISLPILFFQVFWLTTPDDVVDYEILEKHMSMNKLDF